MKISVNDKEIFNMSEIQNKVLSYCTSSDTLDSDLEESLLYIINHKYDQCMVRLKQFWLPKLKDNGVTSIPIDDEELALLIFSQPNYKDRKTRDLEEEI